MLHLRTTLTLLAALTLSAVSPALAQDTMSQPADDAVQDQPTSAPADADRTPIMAKVIEVHGDVKQAELNSKEWKPVALGDELPEHTKILTGVRSSVKLQIGEQEPYTCMLIESVGLTVLSEAAITDDTKKVRVGVGYGRIRAGVAEGGLKSDFTVDSPVATLSKRGTWGFTLYYERDTDIFEIGLTEYGLVEAINRITAQHRQISPGELVTQAMRMWLDQAMLMRNVAVPDILGQGDIEVAFNKIQMDGLGVTGPGQGREVMINLNNADLQRYFANRAERLLGIVPGVDFGAGNVNTGLRAEGFFGTGRGDQLLSFVLNSNDALVQKGAAKPGRYMFRRSALEAWMQQYKKP